MKRVRDWTFSSVMLFVLTLTGLLALQGCVQTTQEEFREADTGLGDDQIIAILRRTSLTGENTEQAFIDCIAEENGEGSRWDRRDFKSRVHRHVLPMV